MVVDPPFVFWNGTSIPHLKHLFCCQDNKMGSQAYLLSSLQGSTICAHSREYRTRSLRFRNKGRARVLRRGGPKPWGAGMYGIPLGKLWCAHRRLGSGNLAGNQWAGGCLTKYPVHARRLRGGRRGILLARNAEPALSEWRFTKMLHTTKINARTYVNLHGRAAIAFAAGKVYNNTYMPRRRWGKARPAQAETGGRFGKPEKTKRSDGRLF